MSIFTSLPGDAEFVHRGEARCRDGWIRGAGQCHRAGDFYSLVSSPREVCVIGDTRTISHTDKSSLRCVPVILKPCRDRLSRFRVSHDRVQDALPAKIT